MLRVFIHTAGHVNSHSVNGAHSWKRRMCMYYILLLRQSLTCSIGSLAVRCVDSMHVTLCFFGLHGSIPTRDIFFHFNFQPIIILHVVCLHDQHYVFCDLFIYHIFCNAVQLPATSGELQ